jgi:nucleoside-diphosphate-sugar epimerase
LREILVVGASGFVGRAIQDHVLADGDSSRFTFTYRTTPGAIHSGLDRIRLDLLDPASAAQAAGAPVVLWVAGNGDHGLAARDPARDLALTAVSLLALLSRIGGSLCMLSSAATYFGLTGPVDEEVDHVSPIPYGAAKQAAETYARWHRAAGRLAALRIYRLMYAFGPGELPRRLVARCAAAARGGEPLRLVGGGRSFLNPLPVSFVAGALVQTALDLAAGRAGPEAVNLNHPDRWTVMDVVHFLRTVAEFPCEVIEGGEEWPVTFWGSTDRMVAELAARGESFPEVEAALRRCFETMIEETTR